LPRSIFVYNFFGFQVRSRVADRSQSSTADKCYQPSCIAKLLHEGRRFPNPRLKLRHYLFSTSDVTIVKMRVSAFLKVVRSPLTATWLCVLLSAAAIGAPLNIIETTDFQNVSPGAIIGTFDVGLNTVSGSVNGVTLSLVGDFQDSFTLILPAGLTVTSAQVVITNFTYGNGVAGFQIGEMFLPSFIAITGNGTYVFLGDSSNFPPGSLNISVLPPASTNNPGSIPPSGLVAGGFNYTLQYQVAAVPEPSTTALIAIGLLMIVTKRCGPPDLKNPNSRWQAASFQ
jgi:hypothetical protein